MRVVESLSSLWLDTDGRRNLAMSLGRLSILLFLAVLPFSHNAAGKNLALFGMLIAASWLMVRHRLQVDWHSPILRALAAVLAVLLLTSALGTDPLDSLNELRKHFLPGILMLALIPVVFRERCLIDLLLSVVAASFLLRTGLMLVELAEFYPDLGTGRSEGFFIKGFAMDAVFYLPVLAGLMLGNKPWRWPAAIAIVIIGVAMLLLQGRAPVLAGLAGLFALLLALRRWRILAACLAAVIVAGAVVTISKPQLAGRFASIINPQTYAGADGLSIRNSIWKGVIEITRERSWIGYGFGWKKLGAIAVERGHVDRWRAQADDPFAKWQSWYFSLPTDKVNPHNLYLQIYFESGLVGLAAYLAMLGVLFWQALGIVRRGKSGDEILGAILLAYLAGHVIMGLANGLWLGLGPSFALLALIEGARQRSKPA